MIGQVKKGRLRKLNNDSIALGYIGRYLVVVIVDAAEKLISGRLLYGKNTQGKRLASYWADECINAISLIPEAVEDKKKITKLLVEQHKKLKHYYLHEVASFGVLVFDTELYSADWYYAGDCLLGYKDSLGAVHWLHKPHRLDELLDSSTFPEAKYTLTKYLKARRFISPDYISIKMGADSFCDVNNLLIATDGYWCEHLQQGVAKNQLEDDSSVLKIKFGKRNLKLQTDAPNISITYQS